MTARFFLVIALPAALLFGCVGDPAVIRDLSDLSQQPTAYLDAKTASMDALSAPVKQSVADNCNRILFSAWDGVKSPSANDVEHWFAYYEKRPGFGENKQRREKSFVTDLRENADLGSYPNLARKAITVKIASLRLLPTQKPIFNDPSLPGEGYPFDTLQNSALPAHTPIFVSHISKDKGWVWAVSAYASGWMAIDEMAWVSDDVAKEFQSGQYAALVAENVPLVTSANQLLFSCGIGTQLPMLSQSTENVTVKVAVANENHDAVLKTIILPKTVAQAKPLSLTAQNVAILAQKMLNQAYGWGGLNEDRDCSSTVQDLFMPFGIWLPRNSNYWIADYKSFRRGVEIRLKDLKPEDKEKMIVQNGIPFLTVLWMKGHVMLYIGEKKGHALIFHNIWGLRTRDGFGMEGRRVIGKAVITTLQPGKEQADLDANAELLKRIEGMTLLVPRYE